jgi:hypothetical protein
MSPISTATEKLWFLMSFWSTESPFWQVEVDIKQVLKQALSLKVIYLWIWDVLTPVLKVPWKARVDSYFPVENTTLALCSLPGRTPLKPQGPAGISVPRSEWNGDYTRTRSSTAAGRTRSFLSWFFLQRAKDLGGFLRNCLELGSVMGSLKNVELWLLCTF